jgi:curved DNA-binding protein CbpA
MSNPYDVLDLPADSSDEDIRRRYLELVKQFPPERYPEKFAAIRAAYDELHDLDARMKHRLFEAGRKESLEALVEEVTCRRTRQRLSLHRLLQAVGLR